MKRGDLKVKSERCESENIGKLVIGKKKKNPVETKKCEERGRFAVKGF